MIEIDNKKMLQVLQDVDKERENNPVVNINEGEGKASKPKLAKMLALQNIKELYYTNENLAYVKINLGKHNEIVRTDSLIFKHWLIYLFEQSRNDILSDKDIKTAISSIDSLAFFKGKRVNIYLRIAEKDDVIYLDLCNEQRQVLEINSEGFKVLDESPVLFGRTEDMDEIPIPIMDNKSDYMKLGNYLNFGRLEDLNMIVAFLLASFRPSMPKPLVA